MNFEDVLNQCIDRINAGQPIDNILDDYPEYADDLIDLLDLGTLVPDARPSQSEINEVMFRLTTNIDALIEEEFDDKPIVVLPRRITRFPYQRVATILIVIAAGFLILTLLRDDDDDNVLNPPTEVLITVTYTPSATPTATQTVTPSPTGTATHTAEPSNTPTATPSPTVTPTFTSTVVPSATPITPTLTPDGCQLPEGWTTYRVQAGDTVSGIAVRSSANLDDIYTANCLERGDFIIVGQEFFVPRAPIAPTAIATLTPIPPTPAPVTAGDNPQSSGQTNTNPDNASGSNNNNRNDSDDDDDFDFEEYCEDNEWDEDCDELWEEWDDEDEDWEDEEDWDDEEDEDWEDDDE